MVEKRFGDKAEAERLIAATQENQTEDEEKVCLPGCFQLRPSRGI